MCTNGKSAKARKRKSKSKAQRRAEKIIQMSRAGKTVVEIMEELDVSHAVVTRHLTNAATTKRKPEKGKPDAA